MIPDGYQIVSKIEEVPPEPRPPLFTFELVVAMAVASFFLWLVLG